jgi:shikimate dehydrogenase
LGATDQRFMKLGLIGHPVSHSISPLLHGAALSYADLDGEYNLIDVIPQDLNDRVKDLIKEKYVGWNVTVPHKKSMYKLVDELTAQAQKVGAVNTVGVTGGGKLIGHNTDLGGFISAMKSFVPAEVFSRPCVAVVMGAGGAARAAVWGLIELGCTSIGIVARDVAQAQLLREEVFAFDAKLKGRIDITAIRPDCLDALAPNVIINCTPIGLKVDDQLPDWMRGLVLSASHRPQGAWMYDMVYGAKRTTILLSFAEGQPNIHVADGVQMLIHQALQAFEYWTGVKVPSTVMETAIRS